MHDKMTSHHDNDEEDSDDEDDESHSQKTLPTDSFFQLGNNDTNNGGVPPQIGTLDAFHQLNPITICRLEAFQNGGVVVILKQSRKSFVCNFICVLTIWNIDHLYVLL